MEVSFTILRTAVMAKVEGLTVMLSGHNPGVPFETLWASAGDQGKLDLYYKEAVGDFEDTLKKWIKTSTAKFDYLAVGTDYTVTFVLPPDALAATKLNGLTANRIQDYFAHAILASWLADLPEGTPVKPDYATTAASDLTSIQELLMERDRAYSQSERAEDSAHQPLDSFVLTQSERTEDTDTVRPRNDWTDWSPMGEPSVRKRNG